MAQPSRIQGATHTVGRGQGFTPVPLRHEVREWDGQAINTVSMAFEFTPEELVALAAGEPLIINMFGITIPPMMVMVGDPMYPSEPDMPYLKPVQPGQ